MRRPVWFLPVVLGLSACNGGPLSSPATGLTGSVVRGPITPVCIPNIPCSAPFAATFTVWQGSRLVASFGSDAQGHFTVRLEPGTYRVVPDPDAPIIDPPSQAKTATVGPMGLTAVQLEFDTGIR